MEKPLTILLADDHAIFRQAIRRLVVDHVARAEVIEVGGFDSALEVLAASGGATLAVLDLSMPGMAGGASVRALRDIYPDAKVMVLSASEARSDVLDILDAGAHGYVAKSAPPEEIARAINYVLAGNIYAPPLLATAALESGAAPKSASSPASAAVDLGRFTPRQQDVIRLLAAGKSNKEIARTLDLAEGTVKIHLAAIFRVLEARNRTEAVARAAGVKL